MVGNSILELSDSFQVSHFSLSTLFSLFSLVTIRNNEWALRLAAWRVQWKPPRDFSPLIICIRHAEKYIVVYRAQLWPLMLSLRLAFCVATAIKTSDRMRPALSFIFPSAAGGRENGRRRRYSPISQSHKVTIGIIIYYLIEGNLHMSVRRVCARAKTKVSKQIETLAFWLIRANFEP